MLTLPHPDDRMNGAWKHSYLYCFEGGRGVQPVFLQVRNGMGFLRRIMTHGAHRPFLKDDFPHRFQWEKSTFPGFLTHSAK